MIAYEGVKQYIDILEKANVLAKSQIDNKEAFFEVAKKILNIQEMVQEKIFQTRFFSAISYGQQELMAVVAEPENFVERINIWIELINDIRENLKQFTNRFDIEFYALMTYFNLSEPENIISDMKNNYLSQDRDFQDYLKEYYNSQSFMWGSIDIESNNLELFLDRIDVIKTYENDFIWLYGRLADNRSKKVLLSVLKNWISFSQDDLRGIREVTFPDYCDYDILKLGDDEVYVDCGAYNGDSVINFIEYFIRYKRIFAFEAAKTTYEKLLENTTIFQNVECINKAVGDGPGTIFIGDDDEAASILKGGDMQVEMVSLDDEIKEPISIVKMDIEGAEKAAINGMAEHIKQDRPKLVICVYHGNRDIIEVPIIIDNIRDDYKFYLRYNGPVTHLVDIVLYAV